MKRGGINIYRIAAEVSETAGVTCEQAEAVLRETVNRISHHLIVGRSVTLGDLGTFAVVPPRRRSTLVDGKRKKRLGKPTLKFQAGRAVKDALSKYTVHRNAGELAWLGAADIYYRAMRQIESGASVTSVRKMTAAELRKQAKAYVKAIPLSCRREYDHYGEARRILIQFLERGLRDTAKSDSID